MINKAASDFGGIEEFDAKYDELKKGLRRLRLNLMILSRKSAICAIIWNMIQTFLCRLKADLMYYTGLKEIWRFGGRNLRVQG